MMQTKDLLFIDTSTLSTALQTKKHRTEVVGRKLEVKRQDSIIEEESPLVDILDTGRFNKKFKNRQLIGQGGFGKVYKATYQIDQKLYAIKSVRIHIPKRKMDNPMQEICKHRMYREIQAASSITSENIVRYFNSWFEELEQEDRESEKKYREDFLKILSQKK